MPADNKKVIQLLRVYGDMNDDERRLAYQVIKAHQIEVVLEKKDEILVEGMKRLGAFMGPSSGGCPRCGYPN